MTTKYELSYLEEIHPDGSVKHTYDDPPLNPSEAPVYEVVEDFLTQLNVKPSILILRDLLVEQAITVNCTKTTDIPSIITTFLSEEDSDLHYLYSYPKTVDGDVIMAGLEFNNQIYNPLQEYRASGTKLIESK